MNYLNEEQILMSFGNLIQIESQIYDLMMEDLFELEKDQIKDIDAFNKTIKKISLLKTKEKRVLEKIDTAEYYFNLTEIISAMIMTASDNDSEKAMAIDERLDFIFNEQYNRECMIEEELEEIDIEDYVDLEEYDEEKDGPIKIEINIKTVDCYTPLQTEFFKYLKEVDPYGEEALKHKYYTCFTNPPLDDELSVVNYDPENIFYTSNKLDAELEDFDINEYDENYEQAKEVFAKASITEFFALACTDGFSKEKLKVAFEQAKFSAIHLNTQSIVDYMHEYYGEEEKYVPTEESLEYVEKLGNDLLEEVFQRDDYNEDMLKELNSEESYKLNSEIRLNSEKYDTLFDLIKITQQLYMRLATLCILEMSDLYACDDFKDELFIVNELLKQEQKCVDSLEFEDHEQAAVMEILDNYLDFSYSMDKGFQLAGNNYMSYALVKQRIANMLFNTRISDISTFKNIDVPDAIIKNFELECLQEYDEHIKTIFVPKYHDACVRFKYVEMFKNHELTKEFVLAGGHVENIVIFDDEIVSKMLEIDPEEYTFDKENMISERAYDIMRIFSSISSDYESSNFDQAAIDFQTIALKTAFKYADQEEMKILRENYQDIPYIEESLLSKKLSSIFEKKEKTLNLDRKRH